MDEEKKKISFIINPKSGTQSKEQILHLLDEKLDKAKYAQEVIYTEYAGHAVEIAAQKAKENVHAVVAIGGDGTINEIARSLVHTKTALGIIPCGSGNGLARHLQISMEPKKAIEIINEGIIDVIDYGKINEVPFFCTCGVGFADWLAMIPIITPSPFTVRRSIACEFIVRLSDASLAKMNRFFWKIISVPLGTLRISKILEPPRVSKFINVLFSIVNL